MPPIHSQLDAANRDSVLSAEAETGPRPLFCCVNDNVPTETTALLQAACVSRGVDYLEIDARFFNYDPEKILSRGDLLFRPAVSLAAIRVELFLYRDGVATFRTGAQDDIYFDCSYWPLLLARAGVPIPRTIPCATTQRDLLRGYVDRLGGFPIVVKCLGGSGGIGVMRVESFPALFSLTDYLLAQGVSPLLCTYIEDATHWRVIVVGNHAIAAYRNLLEIDDFRTYAGTDPADYHQAVPPMIAEVAIQAVHALRLEHGGVDILEHKSGRVYVLEVNYPCYFPPAQQVLGIDIAGTMLDHLLVKALTLKQSDKIEKVTE